MLLCVLLSRRLPFRLKWKAFNDVNGMVRIGRLFFTDWKLMLGVSPTSSRGREVVLSDSGWELRAFSGTKAKLLKLLMYGDGVNSGLMSTLLLVNVCGNVI